MKKRLTCKLFICFLGAVLMATSGSAAAQLAPQNTGSNRSNIVVGPSKILTGDFIVTRNDVVMIHPIKHATFIMDWKNIMIYVDPVRVSGANPYKGFPPADLILVTHEHGDHFDPNTLTAVKKTNTVIVVSKSVYSRVPSDLREQTILMTNGATMEVLGLSIKAIPAYNLKSQNHVKGNGNGYVLTIGGKNIYICGDTDDTPEMRKLSGIDVAFICMDGSFNMGVDAAASAVLEFRPKVVYPYHYNASSTTKFKELVGADKNIEVRLRTWE